MMRSAFSIVRATASEILSEPLSLLLLLSSMALAVLAPAFHYHQFGEATRMARDAGFSAVFLGGSALAVFATIRTFRREIESGTLQMALAHPISRTGFFLAKTAGCAVACVCFAGVLFATMMLVVWGADIGGALAVRDGELARVYGPCLAGGVAMLVVPVVLAAVLNRFAKTRFVLSSFALAGLMAVVALGVQSTVRSELVSRYFPVLLLLTVYALTLVCASAAAAVRFRANAAASSAGVVFAGSVPFVGNYYLANSLSGGGSVGGGYLVLAVLAMVPAMVAFLGLGSRFMNGRDI